MRPAVEQPNGTPSTAVKPDATGSNPPPLIVDDKAVATLKPEGDAFTAKDAELAKVDGTFTETPAAPTDARFQANEQKNDFKLDVDYSGGDDKKPAEVKQPVVDDKMSIGDFFKKLFGLKEKGDERAYDLLDKLEHSKHQKDKHVLDLFKKRDKKDHGAGSRRGYEDFGN
jgi:hypothetical protein